MDQHTEAWRKSSFSGSETACVELAWHDSALMIRDSKNPRPEALRIPHMAVTTFLSTVPNL